MVLLLRGLKSLENAGHSGCPHGTAVIAESPRGTGVHAEGSPAISASGDTELDGSLAVTGSATFRTAGLATVASGATSVTVPARTDVTGSTKVLALAQSPGGVVARVARGTTADTVTIHLQQPATRNVAIAFFVLG